MYDAARAGQMDIFQQALPAGLPANMTNDKGDSLVGLHMSSLWHFPVSPNPETYLQLSRTYFSSFKSESLLCYFGEETLF